MEVPFSRMQGLMSVDGPVSDGTRSVAEAASNIMVRRQFLVLLYLLWCGRLSDLGCVSAHPEPDPPRSSSDPEGPLPLSGVIRDTTQRQFCQNNFHTAGNIIKDLIGNDGLKVGNKNVNIYPRCVQPRRRSYRRRRVREAAADREQRE